MYGSETLVYKENLRIRVVQMNNLRKMFGVRTIDRLRNENRRDLCNVREGVNKADSKKVLKW